MHRKESRSSVEHYRDLVNLSSVPKLFEALTSKRLTHSSHSKIVDCQQEFNQKIAFMFEFIFLYVICG